MKMNAKLRIARGTNNLSQISEMYKNGLGLEVLGSFVNHSGFDGIMLGSPNSSYHFEFTYEHNQKAPHSNSSENLIILYLPDPTEWIRIKNQMKVAGFQIVKSHNPYWDLNGCTFEDPEGYRIVITSNSWEK